MDICINKYTFKHGAIASTDYEEEKEMLVVLKETDKVAARGVMKQHMININNGVIDLGEELVITPTYSFEQFKKTKYYNTQDGIKIIYLDEKQIIDGKNYIVKQIKCLWRKAKWSVRLEKSSNFRVKRLF